MAADWTDEENDLLVADYFAMLREDMAGRHYVKAWHNEALRKRIPRSRGAIEYKHRNVSSVLSLLEGRHLRGYLPAHNYQDSLTRAVARWIDANPGWTDWAAAAADRAPPPGFAEQPTGFLRPGGIRFDPPPALRPEDDRKRVERGEAVARIFDVEARDAKNRALGKAGEERALAHEKAVLARAGRADLAGKVRWTSAEEGDGAGYDIASFTPDGAPRLIEVKTTNGWERTPFHISANECRVAEARREDWVLLRLWNFASGPRAFELRPPLEAHVSLTPTSFRAGFR